MFPEIRDRLRRLYLEDPRPWLVGFSGGKDSTLLAALIFEVVAAIPPADRHKPISVLCTDTRVEIPAVAETIAGTLYRMQRFSDDAGLRIDTYLLKPPAEQSFWVNIIGRGYPPPNKFFRWCTQRLKIDPVTDFVEHRLGRWGEAVLHLGARRAESATRAASLARREDGARTATADGLPLHRHQDLPLHRHQDLPNVWITNPIEHLATGEVWAYLLQHPNPWDRAPERVRADNPYGSKPPGGNRALYKLYANASGGECPLVVDKTSASCGNSRFGCWTCTVVERDRASEGLLASGDERMERLLAFRETLLHYQNPENGKRDTRRMNGAEGNGPLLMDARRELLAQLLALQEETELPLINEDELYLIQRFWNSARDPDPGDGVARLIHQQRGTPMSELHERNELREIEETVLAEQDLRPETLRRMLEVVGQFSDSLRAHGLPEELLRILQDDVKLNEHRAPVAQSPNLLVLA